MEKTEKIIEELKVSIESLDNAIDEYSKNIMGYEETTPFDTIYEEYVSFLTNLKARLELALEIANS